MIYMIITMHILPDKEGDITPWAQKVAAYINEKSNESSYRIVRNITGNARQIHFMAEYESIDEWGISRDNRRADATWHALIEEAQTLVDFANRVTSFYDVVA